MMKARHEFATKRNDVIHVILYTLFFRSSLRFEIDRVNLLSIRPFRYSSVLKNLSFAIANQYVHLVPLAVTFA